MPDSNATAEAYFRARERKGYLLVRAIVALNAVLTVTSFVTSLLVGSATFIGFLVTLFWLFVYAMLYMGHSWARWLFVIAAALNVITLVVMASSQLGLPELPARIAFALAVQVTGMVVMAASAVLLLSSEVVKDFLYAQQTSR